MNNYTIKAQDYRSVVNSYNLSGGSNNKLLNYSSSDYSKPESYDSPSNKYTSM